MLSDFLSKSTYRSRIEQSIGLFIFLLFTIAFYSIGSIILDPHLCKCQILLGGTSAAFFQKIYLSFFSLSTLGFWLVWRKESLRGLKLETVLFSIQFALSLLWQLTFFVWQNSLLSLATLVFLGVVALLLLALFYKREKISVYLFVPWILWIIFLSWNNLSICIETT